MRRKKPGDAPADAQLRPYEASNLRCRARDSALSHGGTWSVTMNLGCWLMWLVICTVVFSVVLLVGISYHFHPGRSA